MRWLDYSIDSESLGCGRVRRPVWEGQQPYRKGEKQKHSHCDMQMCDVILEWQIQIDWNW